MIYNKLKNDGYAVIRNFIAFSEVEMLKDEIMKVGRLKGFYSTAPLGEQVTIRDDHCINNIHYYSELFLDLCTEYPHINEIKEILNDPYYDLIPKDQPNFILAQCNARRSDSSLPYHVDVRLKIPSKVTWSVQCILALDHRHSKNGGLKVIPGSHLDCFINRHELNT